jgi:hypothetical protein
LFLFQNSRAQPSILNYFFEISLSEDELANELLASIDSKELEKYGKKPKLNKNGKQ